jgi:hypothetical protein
MESINELMVLAVGVATSYAMVGLRKVVVELDKAPPIVRSAVVVVLGLVATVVSGKLGIDLPADPATWDGVTINSLLTAFAAMGIHAVGKAFKEIET